ncbi:hypothetical protein OL67_003931 (plasmid) [Phaeobacter piscinae]|nr:hypothetical protein OL67_003931 [Phaeobacter piscinae]
MRRLTAIPACAAVGMAFIGTLASAQSLIERPFEGAARSVNVSVAGERVNVNWIYGRSSDVVLTYRSAANISDQVLLNAVYQATGCVGSSLKPLSRSSQHVSQISRANCRTRWGDGKPRAIQIATFRSNRAAQDLFLQLNISDVPAVVSRQRSGGRTYYRVTTNSYQSPSQVAELLAFVKGMGFRDAFILD